MPIFAQTLAPITVKYISIFTLVILFSCGESPEIEEQTVDKWQLQNDSLWKDRNDFIAHPIFHDLTYQEQEFQKFEGLWTCVRTYRNRDQKESYPNYSDLLFFEGKAWSLDYPCSFNMQNYAEDVNFRNDSIFFSMEDRVYIEKKKIEFRSDTLALLGEDYGDVNHFYLRKKYDPKTLKTLKEKTFNEDCFEGKWSLESIGNGLSDEWVITDEFLDHVPRILDFSKSDFFVEEVYLINSHNKEIRFEITQFDRGFSEYYGDESWLWLKEMDTIDGIIYHYMYEPITD